MEPGLQEQAGLGIFSRWKQRSKRENICTQGLLRSRLQTGIPSIIPHHLSQSKSQGQQRFKIGEIDYLITQRTANHIEKWHGYRRVENLGHFCNQSPPNFSPRSWLLNDIILVAWNRPWEYLHHWNWQTLLNQGSFFLFLMLLVNTSLPRSVMENLEDLVILQIVA